jgi:UDPglucose 6-dehydrogenase
MKISVIGAGYVGLTTAACLAQIGHDVFCSESDQAKLDKLQNGGIPIFEPYVEEIVNNMRQAGRLRFGSTQEAIDQGQVIFICVGTPPLPNGDADLSAIEAVARVIAKCALGKRVVVEKSTVPVRTASRLRRHLAQHSSNGLEYDVVSNPEFLREGSAVEDFLHPDRIVVGVESGTAATIMQEVYEGVIQQRFTCPVHVHCPTRRSPGFLVTDTNSAELIKHASNSFLATKISFANMIADLCEVTGADVTKVTEAMGLDPRIGSSFLKAGIGFGGFCFPKDLQAFIRIAERFGCDFSLLKEVEKINQRRIGQFMEKIRQELWVLSGKKLAVWGLAFKPQTDDIRFAPSIALLKALMAEGASVSAYDPCATEKMRELVPEVEYCCDPYEAAKGAEAILLVTEWDEFRLLNWDRLRSIVAQPLLFDGRNMFAPEEIIRHGFRYTGIGRRAVTESNSPVSADCKVSSAEGERRSGFAARN